MLRRRAGRPGLAGTMARTAVIAGTATAVSGSVHRRAAENQMRRPEGQQAMLEPHAGPPADEKIDKIRQLDKLHADGLLSDAEFAAAKASLLGI